MAELKPKKSFLKNTLTLTYGNIGTQAIKIGLVPIITRLFPPESFGAFSTITAFVMIFSSVSHLRFNVAIQLPKEASDTHSVTILSLSLVLFTAFFSTLVVWAFGGLISPGLGLKGFEYLLLFVPFGILLRGGAMVLDQWHLRNESFSLISWALFCGAVCDRIVTLCFGFLGGGGAGGLLSGRYCGLLFTNFMLFFVKGKNRFVNAFKDVSISSIKQNAVRYKQFPKYCWADLLQQLTNHLPVILLALYFNQTIVGYFALTRRVLSEPLLIVGQALARSFFQKAAEMHRENKDVRKLALRAMHFFSLGFIFPMFFLGVFAQEFFKIVFGGQWVEAGFFTQLMLPFFIIDTLVRPMNAFFDVLIRQRERVIFTFVLLLNTVIFFVYGGVIQKPWACLLGYSIFNSIIIFYMLLWLSKQINLSRRDATNVILSYTFITVLFLAPVVVVKLSTESFPVQIFAGVLSLVCYALYYFFYDKYMSKELRTLLSK